MNESTAHQQFRDITTRNLFFLIYIPLAGFLMVATSSMFGTTGLKTLILAEGLALCYILFHIGEDSFLNPKLFILSLAPIAFGSAIMLDPSLSPQEYAIIGLGIGFGAAIQITGSVVATASLTRLWTVIRT